MERAREGLERDERGGFREPGAAWKGGEEAEKTGNMGWSDGREPAEEVEEEGRGRGKSRVERGEGFEVGERGERVGRVFD